MQGKLLKRQLKDKGLFLGFVSRKTAIPYGTLCHYLADHRPMPESKLRLVCLTFDIPLNLFGLDVENSSQQDHEKEAG